MLLTHEFSLPVPLEDAWKTLTDVERVAPCMPGATLDRVDGDEFSGRVALKVGPLKLTYRGDARITERDEGAHRLVIAASGREARGSGTAEATITATLQPYGEGTTVALRTELALTGRPAQLGRGLISEVGGSLVDRFAERLSYEMRQGPTAEQPLPAAPPVQDALTAPVGGRPEPVPGPVQPAGAAAHDDASLDVLALVRPLVARRGPAIATVIAALLLGFLFGRRRRGNTWYPVPYPMLPPSVGHPTWPAAGRAPQPPD